MPEVQARFTLKGPNLPQDDVLVGGAGLRVGRAGSNDLTLDHGEISRHHMQITRSMGSYWVEDLNSSNGVWVNDLRVRPGEPYELKLGDAIRCGPFVFTFAELVQAPTMVEPFAPPSPPAVDELPPRPHAPTFTSGERYSEGSDFPVDLPSGPRGTVPSEPPPTPAPYASDNGYPVGIPRDRSNWLQYLPAIYSEDDFLGRYLLIFESIMNPIIWMIDNFDFYLTPDLAPEEWLRWLASWFDLVLVPELPIERQRAIMNQIGWLFLRRSTRAGLERLLELYFGVRPEIIEPENEPCHFIVRLPLSRTSSRLGRDIADRLIISQKPAFASYTLEIT